MCVCDIYIHVNPFVYVALFVTTKYVYSTELYVGILRWSYYNLGVLHWSQRPILSSNRYTLFSFNFAWENRGLAENSGGPLLLIQKDHLI